MYVSLAFSAFLLVCAAVTIAWHVGAWRQAKQREFDPKERQFRYNQYRRRMQTSILMAVLVVLLPVGQWIMIRAGQEENVRGAWPTVGVAFVGVVLLLLVWIALLALADFVSTKFFYNRLRDTYQLEQTRLQAELRQLQKSKSNGKGNGNGSPLGQGPEIHGPGPEAKS